MNCSRNEVWRIHSGKKRTPPLGFSVMASAPWREVCPLVAEKRSATQKCSQTLDGRGLIATKSRVSDDLGNSDVCRATISKSSHSLHSLARGSSCVLVCHRHMESRDREWGRVELRRTM